MEFLKLTFVADRRGGAELFTTAGELPAIGEVLRIETRDEAYEYNVVGRLLIYREPTTNRGNLGPAAAYADLQYGRAVDVIPTAAEVYIQLRPPV